ncbi:MAG: acyl-CoA synthetase [Gammaproteobacteria bacterium]|nr:MAG: acyl-CoA synthetase [Gammaproteobacteria bacterium]
MPKRLNGKSRTCTTFIVECRGMKKNSQQDMEKELIAITNQLLIELGEPQREIKLSDSLQRLGIDSLARAELFQRVQRLFDVHLPDRLIASAETLDDIIVYLQKASPRITHKIERTVIKEHGERSQADPMQAHTLLDILLLYAEKSPDKAHIYFQNEEGGEDIITYDQLLQSSLRVAQGLKERGLKDGETVAIMLPTHPSFFSTFFGILLAGGIPVPIYPPFRAHMLEAYAKLESRILKNAEVRMLVTFEQAEKLSYLLKAFVPSLNIVTTVDELLAPTPLSHLFKAKSDHPAFIQYTSGSTAAPKGVLLSHYNLLANIRAYGKAVNVTPDSVAVSWLPLYHDMGLIAMWLGSLYYGIPLILMTPFSFLNRPERWLWAIHHHRGTHSGAPNFAYELCVRKIEPAMIEGLDLSSWGMAANGAEKVYPRTLEAFTNKFAPYGFKRHALMPVYGLAESTVGLAIPPLGREFRIDKVDRKKFEEERRAEPATGKHTLEFAACGKALEHHEIRIVDEEDHVLPERHVGSLQFRGPSCMQGYYNNPSATQAILHDGWMDSGDLAYLADDEIFITGRRKDLIIKAGRNLYPAEMEELVGNIAGIRQGCVAAFGMTDNERSSEQLIIVAETREKNKAKREQIIEKVKETITMTLDIVPDQVILVAPRVVPKTSSGKLQRAACKTMYLEGRLGKKQIPAWLQIGKLSGQWVMKKIADVVLTIGKWIYTTYVAVIALMTLLPLWLFVYFASSQSAAKACRLWTKYLLKIVGCPVKVIGTDNLTKASPVIFAANHASYIDVIVALSVVPPGTRFVGKKELFSAPILRTFARKLDYLAVDRLDFSKGIEDTQKIEATLKAGHAIFIFPEGTFGYAAGLRPFRLGAFKMAVETQVPICPVALNGTRTILRDDEKLLRPGKVIITISEPIAPGGTEWQNVTQLRAAVRAEIATYCGEPSLDMIAAQTIAPKLPRT